MSLMPSAPTRSRNHAYGRTMRAAVSASTSTGSRMPAWASRYRSSICLSGLRKASTSSTTCAGSSARMLRISLLTGVTVADGG